MESRPGDAQVLTEVKNLQEQLQNTMTALQQQDPSELLDDEKVNNMRSVVSDTENSCC